MFYPSRVSRTSAFVILISFCMFRSGTSQHGNVPNDEGEILYSDSVSIKKMDLRSFPGNATTIVSDLRHAMEIDYHLEKKLVVWTDFRERRIYSTSIDGRGEKKILLREDIRAPGGLAVDWVHGNIYWTDTDSKSISVATLDGEMRKLLFRVIGEPRGIVVNPSEGWMFWTHGRIRPRIERAAMDGSRRSTIVSKDIEKPYGLAIDYDKRKLYWVDVALHSISCSNYDGSNVTKIFVSYGKLGLAFAVDAFQDSLYWSDSRTRSVFKLKLDTNETSDFETKPLYPTGIRIYHPAKQPKVTSYCGENNNKCPNGLLCLPTPRGTDAAFNYVCVCPDGKDCSRIECGGHITAWSRKITSPNYPDPYPNDLHCEWMLKNPNDLSLTIEVTDFELEDRWDCGFDYLIIGYVNSTSSLVKNQYCGRKETPFVIREPVGSVILEFRTDATRSRKGFEIKFYSSADACPHHHPVLCHYNRCKPTSFFCFGKNDCADHSDEEYCDETFRTPSIEFIANVTEPDGTLTIRDEEGGEIYSTVGMISGVTVAFVIGISMVGFCIYKRCQRRNTITSLENTVYQASAENVVINRT